MAITIQIEQAGDWERVYYKGPINEDAELHLGPLVQQLGKNVVFNFRQVEFVNSCGVRAWITFLRDAEKGRNIIFEECTPEIVNQINMIPNFKSSAKISSVYSSYACNSCGFQKWQLFEENKNMPKSPDADLPPVKCDKCGEEMEMEDLEDEFFAWVQAG